MILKTSMELPDNVRTLHHVFTNAGYELYLVGGAVRDFLMDIVPKEYDFATNASPQAVTKLFKKVIPTGIAHGTVTVLLKGCGYEITTYRMDGMYSNHRHPDTVRYASSIQEDLKRRDFTINGFAYDLQKKKIMDLFEGNKHLREQQIQTIGNPSERFEEDALRMMRACRFAAQLGFSITKGTLEAMMQKASLICHVASERIRDELIKIIMGRRPSLGFEAMRLTGLLDYLLPELEATVEVSQNRYHKYDVYYHTMHVIDSFTEKDTDYRLRLSGLFHDIGKPNCRMVVSSKSSHGFEEATFYNHEIVGARITKKIMKRLCFSKEDIHMVSHLTRHHMFHYTKEWTDGAVRRFVRKVGQENLGFLFALRQADRIGNGMRQATCEVIEAFKDRIEKILKEDAVLKISDLDINGNDLMEAFDLKPSKLIGSILNVLLENVLDHPENNHKDILLGLAREHLHQEVL